MAKGKWTVDNGSGLLTHTFKNGTKVEFDITKVFSNWGDLNPVQKFVVQFGVNKRLSNVIALGSELRTSVEEKIKLMTGAFQDLVDGKLKKTSQSDIDKAINALKKQGIYLSEADLRKAAEDKELREMEEEEIEEKETKNKK